MIGLAGILNSGCLAFALCKHMFVTALFNTGITYFFLNIANGAFIVLFRVMNWNIYMCQIVNLEDHNLEISASGFDITSVFGHISTTISADTECERNAGWIRPENVLQVRKIHTAGSQGHLSE